LNGDIDKLAERVRGHDSAALAEFMQVREASLLAFVDRRLGNELRGKMEAQDVLQELAVKALRELGQTDLSARDPFGWLCQLAEQCIIDGHRRFSAEKRAAGREVSGNVRIGDASQDLIALLSASLTSPTKAVVRNERQARLEEALASFPAEHRELLRLRYGEGLATKDVAARLGKSEVATRVLLSRVVHRLQDLLGSAEAG
jgi:RNA polymerase sigma-70 factor (ECF subfamily)